MLVLMLPRVSFRVSGFPVASPCLRGKLQNLSFSKVSKQVVMSFCVAGVALCGIPTCVEIDKIGGSLARNARFAAPTCLVWSLWFSVHTLHFTLHTLHSALHTVQSTLSILHFTISTPRFTLHTLHSTLYTLHSTLYTLHFTL